MPGEIKAAAARIGWTLAEVARRTGYTYQSVHGWDKGMDVHGRPTQPPVKLMDWLKEVAEAVEAIPLPDLSRIMTITHDGRTQSVEAWASEIGIASATLHARIKQRLPADELLKPDRRVDNPGRPPRAAAA